METKDYKKENKLLRKYEKQMPISISKEEVIERCYYQSGKLVVCRYPYHDHFFKKGIFDWSYNPANPYRTIAKFLIQLN